MEGAHLLQVKLAPWHVPFHLAGGALIPSSLKLSDSGQIPAIMKTLKSFIFAYVLVLFSIVIQTSIEFKPESRRPMMTSPSCEAPSFPWEKPIKSHDLVV